MTAVQTSVQTDTISDFLDALAAKIPAPGGGAVAGLHLAQGAALVSMVARYSTGPRYAEHEPLVTETSEAADRLRTQALQLIDDDMVAFRGVIASYQLPKSTAPEKESRSAAIALAATRAASVPADVARAAAEVISLAERLLPIANRNVISDVAAAADAARAAATTARVIVEINLSSITDATTRESLILRISGVDELAARADTVTARVRRLLSQ